TNTTVGFTMVVSVRPSGLVDGQTNFYSNGTALVASSGFTGSVNAWQGVTFSGLAAGTYTFTYIPIQNPTQDWDPIDNVIRSSSVSLTAALLNSRRGLRPLAVNGNQGAVGGAIDAALAGGASNQAFSNLSNLPASQIPGVLSQLAGETGASTKAASLQMMNPF